MTYDPRPICTGIVPDVLHNVALVTQRGDESRRPCQVVRDPEER